MTRRVNDFNEFMRDHVNLNPSRYERLKRSDKAVSEYLSQNLVGFKSTERQGSYALGTTIRPVKDTDEYDVDRLVYVEYDSAKGPKDYIDDVYWCLKANGNYADKVQRNTRCVTVNYAGEFKIDVVPCITYNGSHFICNRKTNEYEVTDGTGFRDWFNDKNRITNGSLKLVTRLLKYLRDHKKTFTAPSILLTTLIGNTVHDWEGYAAYKTIPDTLLTVITRMDEFLQSHPTMPEIRNPALPSETFTRHWDQTKYSHFRDMISSYAARIEDAYRDEDEKSSVRKWRDLFGDGFGNLSAMAGAAATVATPRVVISRASLGPPPQSRGLRAGSAWDRPTSSGWRLVSPTSASTPRLESLQVNWRFAPPTTPGKRNCVSGVTTRQPVWTRISAIRSPSGST